MNRGKGTGIFGVLLALGIAVAGCGNGGDGAASPVSSGMVVVVGEVTMIEDNVAVDGGVEIDIVEKNGDTERLLFESLFTSPPPSDDRIKLYEVIRQVELGDRVKAEGKRVDMGVELEQLTILSGR